jgi:hypothetical protein
VTPKTLPRITNDRGNEEHRAGKKHRSADSLLSPMSKDSKRRDGSKIKKIGLPTASPPADRPIAALATK